MAKISFRKIFFLNIFFFKYFFLEYFSCEISFSENMMKRAYFFPASESFWHWATLSPANSVYPRGPLGDTIHAWLDFRRHNIHICGPQAYFMQSRVSKDKNTKMSPPLFHRKRTKSGPLNQETLWDTSTKGGEGLNSRPEGPSGITISVLTEKVLLVLHFPLWNRELFHLHCRNELCTSKGLKAYL